MKPPQSKEEPLRRPTQNPDDTPDQPRGELHANPYTTSFWRSDRCETTLPRKWFENQSPNWFQKLQEKCMYCCRAWIEPGDGKLIIGIAYLIQDEATVHSFCDKLRELGSKHDVSSNDGNNRNDFHDDRTVILSDACTKRYYCPNSNFPGHRVIPEQPTAPGNPPIPGNLVFPRPLIVPGYPQIPVNRVFPRQPTAPGNPPIPVNHVFPRQPTAPGYPRIPVNRVFPELTAPGLGGFWYNGSTYHIFSHLFEKGLYFHINVLEMLAIYVVVKLWGPLWYGKMVLAYSDNMCTVNIINGKEGQKISIAQTLILELIKKEEKLHHFNLVCKHLKGTENFIADILSRCPSDEFIRQYGDSCVEYDAGPVLDEFVEIYKQFWKIFINLLILFPQNL